MKQTQRSLLSLGVLVLLAGAIGGAAWWANKDEAKKVEEKEKVEKLFTFDKSKARGLRVEKNGKLVAELSREGGDKPWALAQPVKDAADQAAVSSVIDKLAELKQKRDLGAETDPKQPGLDAPQLKITVTLEDKSQQGLEVGADNTFDNSLYVRKTGEPTVRMVDGAVKPALDKSAFDLRDKRVARLDDGAEVKSASVIDEDPYTLTREGGAWKLTGPGHEVFEAADANAADRVVSTVRGLRATGIAAETASGAALKAYGLEEPALAIELNGGSQGGKDAGARSIAVGRPEKAAKAYARRDGAGPIYEVDAQIFKDLKKSWFELQDKNVVKFDREQVRGLQIEAPGAAKIAVSRKKESKDGGTAEEQFAVEAPASGAAKTWKIASALSTLAGLRAVAFLDERPSAKVKLGLDKPRVYTVTGEGGKVLARLQIGGKVAGDGKRLYARADGSDRLAELEATNVDALPKTLDEILDVPPALPATDGGTPPAQASVPKH